MKFRLLHGMNRRIIFLLLLFLFIGQASAIGDFEVITTANISNTSHYNSSYMIVSNSTGIHSFIFATETPVNVRVSTNTEAVMQYWSGKNVWKSGATDWNISHNGTHLNLTANLSFTGEPYDTDYIIVNFDPHDEVITTGAYGGCTRIAWENDCITDNKVAYMARSGLDTFWYRSMDNGTEGSNGTKAAAMKAAGIYVILRVDWWQDDNFTGMNWTTVRNNETQYELVNESVLRQLSRIGGSTAFNAISISEEEPMQGFGYTGIPNESGYMDYINVSNRLYNSTKLIYPDTPILSSANMRYMNNSWEPMLIRDGTIDDSAYPPESMMSTTYNEWLLEQANYSETYGVLWSASNNDDFAWTPTYTWNMSILAVSKGMNNIVYYALEKNVLSGAYEHYNFLIADPPYNSTPPHNIPKNRSEIFKETVFKIVDLYSLDNLTKLNIYFEPPTPANNSNVTTNYINLNYSTLTNGSTSITHNWNNSIPIWLRFEESSGLNVQNFGTSGNGTFSGETNVNRSNETLRGYGLYCDGVNDFLTVPSTNASNNITVIGWIKPTNDTGYIIAENTISTDMSFGLYLEGNGTNSYLQSHVNGVNRGLTNKSLNANASYYMFAWTYNNSSGNQFWINGAKNGSLNSYKSNLVHNTTTATVCKRMPSATLLRSTIYDIQVHDRVLTDEEIYSYWAGQFGLNITQSNLLDGSYNATAYIQNVAGDIAQTETRYWTVTTSEAQFTKVEFLWWE